MFLNYLSARLPEFAVGEEKSQSSLQDKLARAPPSFSTWVRGSVFHSRLQSVRKSTYNCLISPENVISKSETYIITQIRIMRYNLPRVWHLHSDNIRLEDIIMACVVGTFFSMDMLPSVRNSPKIVPVQMPNHHDRKDQIYLYDC